MKSRIDHPDALRSARGQADALDRCRDAVEAEGGDLRQWRGGYVVKRGPLLRHLPALDPIDPAHRRHVAAGHKGGSAKRRQP